MTPGDFLYAPFQRPARPVRVLGIDPGTEGGLSLFVGARPEVLRAMPVIYVPGQGRPRRSKAGKMVAPRGHNEYDEPAFVQLIKEMAPDVVFCEKEWAMNKGKGEWVQGVSSVFTFAQGYGTIRGVLAAMGVPTKYIPPQEWQKAIFMGLPDGDTKEQARWALERRWPDVSFLATPRSKKPHTGICDAACLAYYGSLQIPPTAGGEIR